VSPLACTSPLPIDQLVDYELGELPAAAEEAFEAHLFECDACARRLDAVVSLGQRIRRLGQEGQATVAVSEDVLARAAAAGARVRQYRLEPGASVACTAGPDDTYVAIRLAVPLDDVLGVDLEVAFHDLDTGERHSRRVEDVPVDAGAHEVVLLFPGDVVRAYPRSRWTIEARARRRDAGVSLGPYVLDHTPWERLPR
jgi:hypothetical protein